MKTLFNTILVPDFLLHSITPTLGLLSMKFIYFLVLRLTDVREKVARHILHRRAFAGLFVEILQSILLELQEQRHK